jgi:hypothetical protein
MMLLGAILSFNIPEHLIKAGLQIFLFDEEYMEFWNQKIIQRKQKSSFKLSVYILEYFNTFLLVVCTSVQFYFS